MRLRNNLSARVNQSLPILFPIRTMKLATHGCSFGTPWKAQSPSPGSGAGCGVKPWLTLHHATRPGSWGCSAASTAPGSASASASASSCMAHVRWVAACAQRRHGGSAPHATR